jgi:hypothetical protein
MKKNIKKSNSFYHLQHNLEQEAEKIIKMAYGACCRNDLPLLKNLLTSTTLNNSKYIDVYLGDLLQIATDNGNLNILKYLITSDELIKKPNVYYKKSQCFHYAIVNKKDKIINYLIFEYEIQKNKDIRKILQNYPDVEKLFLIREKLNCKKELVINPINNNKKSKL